MAGDDAEDLDLPLAIETATAIALGDHGADDRLIDLERHSDPDDRRPTEHLPGRHPQGDRLLVEDHRLATLQDDVGHRVGVEGHLDDAGEIVILIDVVGKVDVLAIRVDEGNEKIGDIEHPSERDMDRAIEVVEVFRGVDRVGDTEHGAADLLVFLLLELEVVDLVEQAVDPFGQFAKLVFAAGAGTSAQVPAVADDFDFPGEKHEAAENQAMEQKDENAADQGADQQQGERVLAPHRVAVAEHNPVEVENQAKRGATGDIEEGGGGQHPLIVDGLRLHEMGGEIGPWSNAGG